MRVFAMEALRDLHPGACNSDAKVAFDGMDPGHLRIRNAQGESSPQMRLLGKQLIALADYFDSEGPQFEEVPR